MDNLDHVGKAIESRQIVACGMRRLRHYRPRKLFERRPHASRKKIIAALADERCLASIDRCLVRSERGPQAFFVIAALSCEETRMAEH